MAWLRTVPGGVEVVVWVVPRSSREGIDGLHGDGLRVRVTAPPHGGEANRAVLRLLAEATGARAELTMGSTSRRKTVLLRGSSLRAASLALTPDPPP
jgi:uncharacterized protein